MAKRKRYLYKYTDDRFTLIAWVAPDPWPGINMRYEDKKTNHGLGASWSLSEKDWIDFTKCIIAHINYINQKNNKKEQ